MQDVFILSGQRTAIGDFGKSLKDIPPTKLAEIAQALNLRGIQTARGSQFTPTHIHRLLKAP